MNLRYVLDSLMKGEFICQQTNSKAFQYLQDENFRVQIKDALKPFGRTLKATEGYESFYCAYLSIDNPQDNRKIKSQFEKLRDIIEPAVDFLTFAMRVNECDATIMAGESLHYSALLAKINNSDAYLNELKKIGRHSLFLSKKKNIDTKDRLLNILEGLTKAGLLKLINPDTKIYIATGKITYFHQVIDFIIEHEEDIQLEPDESETQIGLDI